MESFQQEYLIKSSDIKNIIIDLTEESKQRLQIEFRELRESIFNSDTNLTCFVWENKIYYRNSNIYYTVPLNSNRTEVDPILLQKIKTNRESWNIIDGYSRKLLNYLSVLIPIPNLFNLYHYPLPLNLLTILVEEFPDLDIRICKTELSRNEPANKKIAFNRLDEGINHIQMINMFL